MRLVSFITGIFITFGVCADTIDNYMRIANAIPQMEMKADSQSQSWARSARNVLSITTETIAETLLQANEVATQHGKPLFCLPTGVVLDSSRINSLIGQTYASISSQQSDKNKMTISQVAWIGVIRAYPCKSGSSDLQLERHAMRHVSE